MLILLVSISISMLVRCSLPRPTSSNQGTGCGGSLLIHAGCYFLIGRLLLGGLDESSGLGAGWLAEGGGRVPQPRAGGVDGAAGADHH